MLIKITIMLIMLIIMAEMLIKITIMLIMLIIMVEMLIKITIKLIMLIIMVEMAATFVMSKLVYAPEAKASLLNSSWCWLPRRMAQAQ